MTRSFFLALLLATVAGCSDAVEQTAGPTQSSASGSGEQLALADPTSGEAELVSPRLPLPAPESTFPGLAPKLGDPAPRIADVRIELERTTCYGTCPAYTIEIRGDGSVVYEGKKYVFLAEHVDTRIDPALLEPILREMESIDIWGHEHKCRSSITDTPTTRIVLHVGDHARTVEDRFTGRECGMSQSSVDPTWHAGIDHICKLIDEVTHSSQWVGTQEERRGAFSKGR